ncbi:MAG TPA: HTTM domain-containing protein [Fimbriimonadaceae bacterium]|nr:HTTM domain-containing protein [Fimbriimonadaceae bacterium]
MSSQPSGDQPKGVLASLDDWWFGKRSPAALGLFRVAISTVAFLSLLITLSDFDAWYTERGFVPMRIVERWMYYPSERFTLNEQVLFTLPFEIPRINVLSGVTNSWITLGVYLLIMLAAVTTAFGLWTRLSSIVLAVGFVSLHHRNPMIMHSGDSLLRLCLIYIAVAPSGAAVSLDRFMGVWKGRLSPEPAPISMWGQRLIQYQVALLYFTTAWWKWFGLYWKDGTATWYPTQLHEFDRFWVPPFLERQPFIMLTTYGTLLVETALATLVFYKPLRKWALISGIMLHGYIEYRFNIPMFAAIIVSTYICFFEGEEVQAWARRLGERWQKLRLRVLLPQGQALDPQRGAAIRNMDALGLVSYEPGQADLWEARDTSGKPKANPSRSALFRSFGAWPLGLVPGLWRRLLFRAAVTAAGKEDRPAKGKQEARR